MPRRNRRKKEPGKATSTFDGFQNFAARVGVGTDNPALSSANGLAMYGLATFLSRQRSVLDAMFRESWIVNKAVVAIPEDMTRAGIQVQTSLWDADKVTTFDRAFIRLRIWWVLQSALQWSRLYGGSAALMLIDGQDVSTPLNLDSIGRGQFKGLLTFDRWQLTPSATERIKELGPDLGKPEYYAVNASDTSGTIWRKIHHSRLLIFTGLELPYWQAEMEDGWGASMIETMYDRLVGFDSTTLGAAQLVYRAHLRTIKIQKFRDILAAGGPAEEALMKQMDLIRKFQVNEGTTLLDAEDDFQTHSYTFAGLDKVLLSLGEQLSGATGIPLVRLFGQSPSGLNSSGESDLRTYYDTINATQETDLRPPTLTICDVVSRSLFGEPVPEDFWFDFVPLWQLSEPEKASIAEQDTKRVTSAYDVGLIDRSIALRELKASAKATGRWSTIEDEEIDSAQNDPPASELTEESGADTGGFASKVSSSLSRLFGKQKGSSDESSKAA